MNREILKRKADLELQALMFSMDIDWETGSLVPIQRPSKKEFWLQRYLDKLNESDYTVIDNGY